MILRLLLPITAVALILPISAHSAKSESAAALPNAPQPTPDLFAQRPTELPSSDRDHAEERSHSRWMQWLQSLDLSDEQMQQIRAIYQQSRGETSSLRQQIHEKRERMYSLLTSEADSEQIIEIHQQVQTLQQELENQRFTALLEVRNVLTPEQRVQVAETLQQYREQRRSHRRR
ncbi:MAG: Spy/CpxP family protein refolding chaperone [Leptolyngbyaceae cyanobacterium MO_188.B28]|nr:Spy/CpxP family protein refolding chaperone [Leptolyngbyaceae cyanobacterium MO_188.B28]